LADRPTPGPHRGKVKDRASKQLESPLGPGTTEITVTEWQASATDFRKHRKPHHTDRNRHHTTHAPDRTQIRDSSPGRRQAGTKTPQGNAKPVLLAAQESPDDMSDSDGGIRKRTRTLGWPDRWSGTGTICPIGRDNLWRDLRFGFFW